jgi:hypothetical protein
MAASCVGLIPGGLTYEPDGHGMDLVGRFYRMIMRNAGENCCSSASSGLIVSVADLDTILREAHSARLVPASENLHRSGNGAA